MDITIKEVPNGAETLVKKMALLAIERFLKNRDLKVSEDKVLAVEAEVERITNANI